MEVAPTPPRLRLPLLIQRPLARLYQHLLHPRDHLRLLKKAKLQEEVLIPNLQRQRTHDRVPMFIMLQGVL